MGGAAGIGKTRLCERLLASAASAGWTTLRGTAHPEDGPLPYGPVVEALDLQRLLVLLAFRPPAAGSALARVRDSLLAQRVATPLALGPLDHHATATIARRAASHPVDERTAETIWRLPGGNPRRAEELAAAGVSRFSGFPARLSCRL